MDTDKWSPVVSGTIKTSSTGDLIVSYNEECAIHTGLKLNQEVQQLTSAVRQDIRLVIGGSIDSETGYPAVDPDTGDIIDGKVIPSVYGDTDSTDPYYGVITMCGRAFSIDTNLLSTVADICNSENVTGVCDADGMPGQIKEIFFDTFIRTKQAHSWDWVVLDKGAGDHLVTIQSRIYYGIDGLNPQDWDVGSKSVWEEATSSMESCMKDSDPPPDGAAFDTMTRGCVDSILEVGKRGIIVQVDKLPVGTTYG